MDVSKCHHSNYTIQKIDPGLAADIIVCVQRHYRDWIPDDASDSKVRGALGCAGRLVAKLLPVAKKQILVVTENKDGWDGSPDKTILVRVTPAFVWEIASLLSVVRDNQLDYVSKPLRVTSHAWSAKYLESPRGTIAKVSQICVSDREIWFRAKVGWGEYKQEIETDHISIGAIAPPELLVPEFFEVSEQRVEKGVREYDDRIRAIEAAEGLYDTISGSIDVIESELPSPTIAMMDKLWFDRGQCSPFEKQIQRFKELERTLDEWDSIIEEEKVNRPGFSGGPVT